LVSSSLSFSTIDDAVVAKLLADLLEPAERHRQYAGNVASHAANHDLGHVFRVLVYAVTLSEFVQLSCYIDFHDGICQRY
jgi:hypothetical protein